MTTRHRADILVADDGAPHRLLLEPVLGERHTVHTISSGGEALDNVDPATGQMPVLFLTSLTDAADEARGLSLGAQDFIHEPYSRPVVAARAESHPRSGRARKEPSLRKGELERLAADRERHIEAQAVELIRRQQELIAARSALISGFCALAEARDSETGNHIRRTQQYVRVLAGALAKNPRYRSVLDDESIRVLVQSAPLHDVGKVAIPDEILLKPGRLTDEERRLMTTHCEKGRRIIAAAAAELGPGSSFLRCAEDMAAFHHEWWNGAGYPSGLAGEAIPLSARIMAVADVYDALVSWRPYKQPLSLDATASEIVRERGTHFDPDVVDAFQECRDEFAAIALVFQDRAVVAASSPRMAS
ncbi:MAG: HD domain-containing phosphohydrolase [Pseudomonadota bacterium]|nr:HD domain-containing phosphohydrolase [Pseudomonadota bacterium]